MSSSVVRPKIKLPKVFKWKDELNQIEKTLESVDKGFSEIEARIMEETKVGVVKVMDPEELAKIEDRAVVEGVNDGKGGGDRRDFSQEGGGRPVLNEGGRWGPDGNYWPSPVYDYGWAAVFGQFIDMCSEILMEMEPRDWCAMKIVTKFVLKKSKQLLEGKLLGHQIGHFNEVKAILNRVRRCVDTSVMGCGKTYTSVAIGKSINIPNMVVFGPAATELNWKMACRHFGYQMDRFRFHGYNQFLRKVKPYLMDIPRGIDQSSLMNEEKSAGAMVNGEWMELITKGVLLIFDESHWLKNESGRSYKASLLIKTLLDHGVDQSKVLLLSATPFDQAENAVRMMRVLQVIKSRRMAIFNPQAYTYTYPGYMEILNFAKDNLPDDSMAKVRLLNHPLISGRGYFYGGRGGSHKREVFNLMKSYIKPVLFKSMPKLAVNQLQSETYNMLCGLAPGEDLDTVRRGVVQLQRAVHSLQMGRAAQQAAGINQGQVLGSIGQGLRMIEMGKIKTFIKLCEAHLRANAGAKVIIMMNYLEPISLLSKSLAHLNPMVVTGSTKMEKRLEYIQKFQEKNTEKRLLISNLSILAQGIDLDDKFGDYPRLMLISPSYHVINLHQATGRVMRSNTKSKPQIRFIYIKEQATEIRLLNSLAKKSEVIRSALNYDIKLPGDYAQLDDTLVS